MACGCTPMARDRVLRDAVHPSTEALFVPEVSEPAVHAH